MRPAHLHFIGLGGIAAVNWFSFSALLADGHWVLGVLVLAAFSYTGYVLGGYMALLANREDKGE